MIPPTLLRKEFEQEKIKAEFSPQTRGTESSPQIRSVLLWAPGRQPLRLVVAGDGSALVGSTSQLALACEPCELSRVGPEDISCYRTRPCPLLLPLGAHARLSCSSSTGSCSTCGPGQAAPDPSSGCSWTIWYWHALLIRAFVWNERFLAQLSHVSCLRVSSGNLFPLTSQVPAFSHVTAMARSCCLAPAKAWRPQVLLAWPPLLPVPGGSMHPRSSERTAPQQGSYVAGAARPRVARLLHQRHLPPLQWPHLWPL